MFVSKVANHVVEVLRFLSDRAATQLQSATDQAENAPLPHARFVRKSCLECHPGFVGRDRQRTCVADWPNRNAIGRVGWTGRFRADERQGL